MKDLGFCCGVVNGFSLLGCCAALGWATADVSE